MTCELDLGLGERLRCARVDGTAGASSSSQTSSKSSKEMAVTSPSAAAIVVSTRPAASILRRLATARLALVLPDGHEQRLFQRARWRQLCEQCVRLLSSTG